MLAVAVAGAAGVTVVVPALASGTREAASHSTASPRAADIAMIAPVRWHGHLSLAATGRAVKTCVYYATRVGWADNGYYAGDLVTAATICVSESAGDPDLIVCDNKAGEVTGQGNYPKFSCPEGTVSYDRGLWQLNTVGAKGASNTCAFNPVCNAGFAYEASVLGISFAPWSSYDQGVYANDHHLDLVQAAVTTQATGTVTSALLGECLAQSRPAIGTAVVVVNCGSGTTSQLWSVADGKLRSGSSCAAVVSAGGKPGVVLARCGRQKTQDWAAFGRDELRNSADGKCLTDPNSSLTAGTQVTVTSCGDAKDQTWWVP